MTPSEIKSAREKLGLTVAQFAALLETDPQTVRRMEISETASTFRRPAVRMERLIRAYSEGYRPPDWPGRNER
ncbi:MULTISPECIES: helix-turn-helix domain-containing protein [unclassified Haematobacter]|uniref:helix-turn-helix domain-containing protein n=1 Tax=unclassified Haematobacter TaxID=2640585 RepID=UPI0025BF98C1|nr:MULTISPECIES: helix-turn-helix domain-containing protein [unclassified Haematobacter]